MQTLERKKVRKKKEIAGKRSVSNPKSYATVLLRPLFKYFLIFVTHFPTTRYILQSTKIVHFFYV